jgi:hypothetical protein
MAEPRDLANEIERNARLPAGQTERFAGYGVMGLPFTSGHLLALRRFPASSVGPAYTTVWHRSPEGRWTFYTNVDPLQSCPRYFGSEVSEVKISPITVTWSGPRAFSVCTDDGALFWEVRLGSTVATRSKSTVGRLLPDHLWHRPTVLSMMEPVASRALQVGRVRLHGTTSNGQTFIANPKLLWSIPESRAEIGDLVLDQVGPLREQARIADFWIPQQGIFAIGSASYEPFDPTRHLAVTTIADRQATPEPSIDRIAIGVSAR